MEAGVRLTKDLVGGPANYVTPSLLAETAMQIAADTGMTCKILEKDDCVKLKMGSYLAVSQVSSSLPPFLPPCISYTCLHHLISLHLATALPLLRSWLASSIALCLDLPPLLSLRLLCMPHRRLKRWCVAGSSRAPQIHPPYLHAQR